MLYIAKDVTGGIITMQLNVSILPMEDRYDQFSVKHLLLEPYTQGKFPMH